MQTHVLWCIWSKQQIQSKMLLNLYPTPIHKSAITNSLSKVCAGRCVLISSQLFVWKPWWGPSTQLASCSFNSWSNLTSTTPPTERHCGPFADSWNVWAGRLGSSPRGLDPQMARCRQHKKTVSWKIFCSLKVANLSFLGILSIITPDKPLGMILERKGREIDKSLPVIVENLIRFYLFFVDTKSKEWNSNSKTSWVQSSFEVFPVLYLHVFLH